MVSEVVVSNPRYTCAVWYWRHHCLRYELFETEKGAARFAAGLEDDGEGVVSGVQFSDGRTIEPHEWELLAQVNEENYARAIEEARQRLAAPAPLTRTVRDPFHDRKVKIKITEPEWLGR